MNNSEQSVNLEKRIKRHIKAQFHDFFCVVPPGFEETARRELSLLGVSCSEEKIVGGIEFEGKLEDCYKVNFLSRILARVLMRITEFKATNFRVLYKKSLTVPWELYLPSGANVGFSIESVRSRLYHKGAIEEEFKKTISERFKTFNLDVSFNEEKDVDIRVFVRFENDKALISVDTTGTPLYKRGYKTYTASAPLRENLAAAILIEAGIEKKEFLIDPMCGSATFSIESFLIKNKIPAGLKRSFSFEKFPSFSEKSFNFFKRKIIEEADKNSKENGVSFSIIAFDKDPKAVELAEKNIKNIESENKIEILNSDFFDYKFEIREPSKTLVVLNPPYGKRLSEKNAIATYNKIGLKLKKNFNGVSYAVIIPSSFSSKINIPFDKRLKFKHGGISAEVRIKF